MHFQIELPDELNEEQVEQLMNKYDFMISEYADDELDSDITWIRSQPDIYDSDKENLFSCAKCGAWTSNKLSENVISEFGIGCEYNGELLCDECLPPEHPMAF